MLCSMRTDRVFKRLVAGGRLRPAAVPGEVCPCHGPLPGPIRSTPEFSPPLSLQELPGGEPPGKRGPDGGQRAGPLLPGPEHGPLRGHLEHAGPEGKQATPLPLRMRLGFFLDSLPGPLNRVVCPPPRQLPCHPERSLTRDTPASPTSPLPNGYNVFFSRTRFIYLFIF